MGGKARLPRWMLVSSFSQAEKWHLLLFHSLKKHGWVGEWKGSCVHISHWSAFFNFSKNCYTLQILLKKIFTLQILDITDISVAFSFLRSYECLVIQINWAILQYQGKSWTIATFLQSNNHLQKFLSLTRISAAALTLFIILFCLLLSSDYRGVIQTERWPFEGKDAYYLF